MDNSPQAGMCLFRHAATIASARPARHIAGKEE
jgi:hypothetical protein